MHEAGFLHLSAIDLGLMGLFAGLILLLGFWRPAESFGKFIMAGRNLSGPAFVMSLVCSWYGGILGISEYSYTYGLSNWFVFGVPYYLYALIFALVLARKARRSELLSLPDRFQLAYGTSAAKLCGMILFVTAMPAAYLLMLGKLIEWMLGWSYHVSLLAGAALSTLYLFRGGLSSVVRIHVLQFLTMYIGFAVLVVMLYLEFGGLEFIRAGVPPELLTPTGGQPLAAVLVWYVIASTTLVEPLFYERAFATRSEKIVLPGILVAILCWAVFDFMTTTTGLYARTILGQIDSPVFAFPELAKQFLPSGLFALFLAALIATVASSVDSFIFIAGAALGRDVLARGKELEESGTKRYVQIGSALAIVCAVALAWFSDSVISLWYSIGSITAPALLFPALLAWFAKRPPTQRVAIIGMSLAGGVALFWRMSSFWTADGSYWFGIEPIFVGLGLSAVVLSFGKLGLGNKHA